MDENGDAVFAKRQANERWLTFVEKFAKLEVSVERLTEHDRLDREKYERWFENLRQDIEELKRTMPPDIRKRLEELEGRFSIDQGELEERFKNLELRPEVGEKTDSRIKWLERIAWAVGGGAAGIGLLVAMFEFLSKWAKTPYLG